MWEWTVPKLKREAKAVKIVFKSHVTKGPLIDLIVGHFGLP